MFVEVLRGVENNRIFPEEEFGEEKIMVGATGFEPVTSCV
jgi:hypothetical protein